MQHRGAEHLMRWRFIRSDTIISEAISAFEVGGPSHVDAVFRDGYFGARSAEIGGVPAGLQLRPFDYIEPTWELEVEWKWQPAADEAWEAKLRSKTGAPYDYFGAFSFAFPFEIHNPKAEFCSAAQVWGIRGIALPAVLAKPDWEIDPLEFLLMLSARLDIPGLVPIKGMFT